MQTDRSRQQCLQRLDSLISTDRHPPMIDRQAGRQGGRQPCADRQDPPRGKNSRAITTLYTHDMSFTPVNLCPARVCLCLCLCQSSLCPSDCPSDQPRPLEDDLSDLLVDAEAARHLVLDRRVRRHGIHHHFGYVFRRMASRRQHVRMHNDLLRTGLDAFVNHLGYVGLCNLHVRRIHNQVIPLPLHQPRHVEYHVVGSLEPRAVVNQQQSHLLATTLTGGGVCRGRLGLSLLLDSSPLPQDVCRGGHDDSDRRAHRRHLRRLKNVESLPHPWCCCGAAK
mmetsp:Transcript_6250/g.17972  ORF Transcript_6250/g.17972 Transcript_6250/m.17972 type:complete len:280 (+) Transcript_6250:486-1325(+)